MEVMEKIDKRVDNLSQSEKKEILASIRDIANSNPSQEIERTYKLGCYFLKNYKPYFFPHVDVFNLINLLRRAIFEECDEGLSKTLTDLHSSDRRRLMLLFGCLNELDFGVENQSNREFEEYLLDFFEKKYNLKSEKEK